MRVPANSVNFYDYRMICLKLKRSEMLKLGGYVFF